MVRCVGVATVHWARLLGQSVCQRSWLVPLFSLRSREICVVEDWPTLCCFQPDAFGIIGYRQAVGLRVETYGRRCFTQFILRLGEQLTNFFIRWRLERLLDGVEHCLVMEESGI